MTALLIGYARCSTRGSDRRPDWLTGCAVPQAAPLRNSNILLASKTFGHRSWLVERQRPAGTPGQGIDKSCCQYLTQRVLDLEVIDKPAVALAVLDPVRAKVLAALFEPGSSTTVAHALGQPRQKINYHLRALGRLDLLRLVEERPRRGLTERVMVASARSYVLAPAVLGESAADPARTDRLSTGYLIAIAARMVGDVAQLARRAEKARKPLATLAIDTEIRFASAATGPPSPRSSAVSSPHLPPDTTMRRHPEGVGIVS